MTWLGLLALLAEATPAIAPAQPAPPEEAEIVIQAARGKCKIRFDDRALSDRELNQRAGEWATLGTPVRVVTPHGAGYKCLSKIMFRLSDRGVRLVRFIDRDETP